MTCTGCSNAVDRVLAKAKTSGEGEYVTTPIKSKTDLLVQSKTTKFIWIPRKS